MMRSVHSLLDLRGRRALITGGAGYIALAVEEALIELGCKIALLDLNMADCQKRAKALNGIKKGSALPFACDLASEDQTRSVARAAIKKMGGLDILIHMAAYGGDTRFPGWVVPYPQQTTEAFDRALKVNLSSAFTISQEARAALEKSKHGSIILFGSTYGIVGGNHGLYKGTDMGNPVGYGASKGGLIHMAQCLATVMAPKIRVNALSPGGVFSGQPKVFVDRYVEKTPLGRMAEIEDMKGAVAFLASDASAYMTGQNLVIDGGWTAW
jgi:NAD(P)-dependent dehydrogenase (short-subunit alcohol dehydrogenase family)